MPERNLFDEAARILAMPLPRRKAFKYLARAFAASLLPSVWFKEAAAAGFPCGICNGICNSEGCYGRHVDDPCITGPGKLATAQKHTIAE